MDLLSAILFFYIVIEYCTVRTLARMVYDLHVQIPYIHVGKTRGIRTFYPNWSPIPIRVSLVWPARIHLPPNSIVARNGDDPQSVGPGVVSLLAARALVPACLLLVGLACLGELMIFQHAIGVLQGLIFCAIVLWCAHALWLARKSDTGKLMLMLGHLSPLFVAFILFLEIRKPFLPHPQGKIAWYVAAWCLSCFVLFLNYALSFDALPGRELLLAVHPSLANEKEAKSKLWQSFSVIILIGLFVAIFLVSYVFEH